MLQRIVPLLLAHCTICMGQSDIRDSAAFTTTHHAEIVTKKRSVEAGGGWMSIEDPQAKAAPLAEKVHISPGTKLEWQWTEKGVPFVLFRTAMKFSRTIVPPGTIAKTIDVDEELIITQPIVLSRSSQGIWVAVAGPMTIEAYTEGEPTTLLDSNKGLGEWASPIGKGGLICEDYVDTAVRYAKATLAARYSAQEIKAILATKEVSLLLRPTEAPIVTAAASP